MVGTQVASLSGEPALIRCRLAREGNRSVSARLLTTVKKVTLDYHVHAHPRQSFAWGHVEKWLVRSASRGVVLLGRMIE